MHAIKDYLLADKDHYAGHVDPCFQDLATQFSRFQHARSDAGGAALTVYFQNQKVVDIYPDKNQQQNNGKMTRYLCVTPPAKVSWQRLRIFW